MEGGCCAEAPLGTRMLCQAPWEFSLLQENTTATSCLPFEKGRVTKKLFWSLSTNVPLTISLKLFSQQCTHNLAFAVTVTTVATAASQLNHRHNSSLIKHHFEETDQH